MYSLDWLRGLRAPGAVRYPVRPTVWALGFTSFFTDISSEMVSSILPMYLVLELGLNPLQFGILDGLYQGVTALLRLASGFFADRWRKYKETAIVGYGLSALCKLGLLAAGNAWVALGAILALDRTGKGIRTAPRDALIARESDPVHMASAFGVHRALDAAGALAGPAVAFGVLSAAPRGFDAVFVISFCFSVVGLGVLVLFVPRTKADAGPLARSGVVSAWAALRLLSDGRFRTLVISGGLLSVLTMSDSFIYLAIHQRMAFSPRLFPLLYLGTALFYVLFAVPAGRLADKIGRDAVFIGGHVLLLGLYASSFQGTIGFLSLVGYLALFGAFFAATDGVLMAMAAVTLPRELAASGLALLTTVTSLARLVGSIWLGWLWSRADSTMAAKVFFIGLFATLIVSACMLYWRRPR